MLFNFTFCWLMDKLKKIAVSNVAGLCLAILLGHHSSLAIMYNSTEQHIWDVITIVMAFFGIKYLTLLIINFHKN